MVSGLERNSQDAQVIFKFIREIKYIAKKPVKDPKNPPTEFVQINLCIL